MDLLDVDSLRKQLGDLTNTITSISNVFAPEVKEISEHVQVKADLKALKDELSRQRLLYKDDLYVQLEDQCLIITMLMAIMLFTFVYVIYFMLDILLKKYRCRCQHRHSYTPKIAVTMKKPVVIQTADI